MKIGRIYNKALIQDEISDMEERIEKLKVQKTNLIDSIKKNVYWNKSYSTEDKQPNDLIMSAALYYFLQKNADYIINQLKVTHAKEWKTEVYLPYYYIHLDNFQDNYGNTPPIKLSYVEDCHTIIDLKILWIYAIKEDNYTASLAQFTQDYKGQKLFDYVNDYNYRGEHPYKNRLFLVNCVELDIELFP